MGKEERAKKISRRLGTVLLGFMLLLWLYAALADLTAGLPSSLRLPLLVLCKIPVLLLPTVAFRFAARRGDMAFPEVMGKGRLHRHLIGASAVGFIIAVEILYMAVFPSAASSMGVTERTSLWEYVLLFFLYVLLPSMLEELFFRRTVIPALLGQGGALALLVSALTFGLLHFSAVGFPIAFFGGLVLGSAYLATGSYRIVATIHFLCNGFWFASEIVHVYFGTAEQRFMQVAFALCVALCAVGIPTLRSTISAVLTENEPDTASASSFWTVPIILFLAAAVAVHLLTGGMAG